MDRAIHF